MHVKRKSKGFTLVELLVVITIIGMLMSLLLPAIQSARESGRQATCKNNLNNWAKSLLNYEGSRKGFPGLINDLGTAKWSDTKISTPNKRVYGSWVVALLPYLDRSDLYEYWTDGRHVNSDGSLFEGGRVKLGIGSCPSNVLGMDGGDSHCVYRVNAGRQGFKHQSNTTVFGGTKRGDSTYAGLFDLNVSDDALSRMPQVVNCGYQNSPMTIDAIRDGSSNTLMVSENAQGDENPLNYGWATGFNPENSGFSSAYADQVEDWLGFRIPADITSNDSGEGIEFLNGPL